MGDYLPMLQWWQWMRWRPTTYAEAALFALLFGGLATAVWWVTHRHSVGVAVGIGVGLAVMNLATRAARIWDRSRGADDGL